MKSIQLLFIFLFVAINSSFSQENLDECKTKLSIFHEYVKSKNYDAAYEPWVYVKNNCPKLSIAIYIDGEKILKHKIKISKGIEHKDFVKELLEVWQMRLEYFPDKTPKGLFGAKRCQLMFDKKGILQKTDDDLYDCFDAAYRIDKGTFTHPKSLYTYFSLTVDLYNDGKKTIQEVFDTYDAIIEKIEEEVKNYAKKLNKLVAREQTGATLSKKEQQQKSVYQDYLKNYDLILKSIETKTGTIADCKNLIPLYTKNFESNKNDSIWLKRAVSRMYHKKCTEDPLYEKLVKAYDEVAPSADTKYFVATILIKKGKLKEGEKYLKESYNLEVEDFKKSKRAYSIGILLKNQIKYSKARTYFRYALKHNPSNGKPHLAIASMYAESAKNCGDTNFNKRAVYWLAAKEAAKASRVDPTLKNVTAQSVKRYKALAPSKQEIHKCACSGKPIEIGCWINDKITVPEI